MYKQKLFVTLTVAFAIASFYLSLWLVMWYKYPDGLSAEETQRHYLAFSIVYGLWLIVLYSLSLLDLRKIKRFWDVMLSLIAASALNIGLASVFFYVQPALLLTPRRFLLLHVLVTMILLVLWYLAAHYFFRKYTMERVYVLEGSEERHIVQSLLVNKSYMG
jgi:hypothetical protein